MALAETRVIPEVRLHIVQLLSLRSCSHVMNREVMLGALKVSYYDAHKKLV